MLIPIRLTLERYSFAQALERMTDDDFAELGKQIWLMEQAGKANDLLKLVEADLALPRDRDLGVRAAAHGADLAHDLAADPRLLLPLRALPQLRGDGGGASRAARRAADARPRDRAGAARAPHRRSAAAAGRSEAKVQAAHERAAARGREPPHRLRHARRLPARRRRRRLRDRAGRHARRRRRVGQRQVGDRALGDAPDRPAGPDRARARASSSRAATSPRSTRTSSRRSAATTSR